MPFEASTRIGEGACAAPSVNTSNPNDAAKAERLVILSKGTLLQILARHHLRVLAFGLNHAARRR